MCADHLERHFKFFSYLNLAPKSEYLSVKWDQIRKKLELFELHNIRESVVLIERISTCEKKRPTRNKSKKRCFICNCVSEKCL